VTRRAVSTIAAGIGWAAMSRAGGGDRAAIGGPKGYPRAGPRQGFVDRGLAREKRWFLGGNSLNPHLFQRRPSPLADDH
jgi:hypothetical protein